ncbi:MAG: Cna B-type domain-containing protein, partial [Alloprevotella sp.]|nr:Cna B-type domain-containing protein [Alloprevotella sp.]
KLADYNIQKVSTLHLVLRVRGYALWLGGVLVGEENHEDILGDGTASFDPETNTLSLSGTKVTTGAYNLGEGGSAYPVALYVGGEIETLTIHLTGTNELAGNVGYGIYAENNLSFTGTGSLYCYGSNAFTNEFNASATGISAKGDITVASGDVTAEASSSLSQAVRARGALTVNGGSLTGTASGNYSYGISVQGALSVNGGSLTGIAGDCGILVYGAAQLTGGTLRGEYDADKLPASYASADYRCGFWWKETFAIDASHQEFIIVKPALYSYADYRYGRTVTEQATGNPAAVVHIAALEPCSVTATKVWDDGDNVDRRRPQYTWLTIKRTDRQDVTDINGNAVATTVRVDGWAGTNFSVEWEDLPTYALTNGEWTPVEYTVLETDEDGMAWTPGGYTKVITGNMADGFTVTNRYTPKQTDIIVTKLWADYDNAAGLRPQELELHLDKKSFITSTADDTDIKDVAPTRLINEASGWKAEWRGLPYNEITSWGIGRDIRYVVREDAEDYTGALTEGDAGLRVTLLWDEGAEKPQTLTATLLDETGTSYSFTATLSEENGWTAQYDGINPAIAKGYSFGIDWTPKQEAVCRKVVSVVRNYMLTNTLIPVINVNVDTPRCGTEVWVEDGYWDTAGYTNPAAQQNRPTGNVQTEGWELYENKYGASLYYDGVGVWDVVVSPFAGTLAGGNSYLVRGECTPLEGTLVAATARVFVNGEEVPAERVRVNAAGRVEFMAEVKAAHDLQQTEGEEPTCEAGGTLPFWTCAGCANRFADENGETEIDEPQTLEPLDHMWGEPTYQWAEDYSTATALRICQRNASHEETETVESTSEETLAPTYKAVGELTYTAVFTTPGFETQTTTVDIPALEPYGIAINETNFPDPAFRQYIAETFDTDPDVEGWLIPEEIEAARRMDVSGLGISDLTGVEHFTALEALDCSQNSLTELNLAQNGMLTELYCYLNGIADTAMDALIASLPAREGCVLRVIAPYVEGEQNSCMMVQVGDARQKGWAPYYWSGTALGEGNGEWLEYEGDDVLTGIGAVGTVQTPDTWYMLDGRRLGGNPAQKGVHIRNGRKVVVK